MSGNLVRDLYNNLKLTLFKNRLYTDTNSAPLSKGFSQPLNSQTLQSNSITSTGETQAATTSKRKPKQELSLIWKLPTEL